MRLGEKLGKLSLILLEFGIDPSLPVQLALPRLYLLAPRIVMKLADAS